MRFFLFFRAVRVLFLIKPQSQTLKLNRCDRNFTVILLIKISRRRSLLTWQRICNLLLLEHGNEEPTQYSQSGLKQFDSPFRIPRLLFAHYLLLFKNETEKTNANLPRSLQRTYQKKVWSRQTQMFPLALSN